MNYINGIQIIWGNKNLQNYFQLLEYFILILYEEIRYCKNILFYIWANSSENTSHIILKKKRFELYHSEK